MDKKQKSTEPFKPSMIHKLFSWIDRLPGPYWLFALVLLISTGLLNNFVAWNAGILAVGEINWQFALTGFFLFWYVFGLDFLTRKAKQAITEYRPLLGNNDKRFYDILFRFSHLRAGTTGIYFVIGAIIGLFFGISLFKADAPEMNLAFPELEIPMYSLSIGLIAVAFYFLFRSLRLIYRLFLKQIELDLFTLDSIYAISRFGAWVIVITGIPGYLSFDLIPSFASGTSYIVFLLISYAIVLTFFLLPLRGINSKLVDEKRKLLSEVNMKSKQVYALIHDRIETKTFDGVTELRETIESLKLERDHIESLRTWPWKTSTLMGLITAFAVPILSSILFDFLASLF